MSDPKPSIMDPVSQIIEGGAFGTLPKFTWDLLHPKEISDISDALDHASSQHQALNHSERYKKKVLTYLLEPEEEKPPPQGLFKRIKFVKVIRPSTPPPLPTASSGKRGNR